MRVEYEVLDKTYWVDFKDGLSRREMRLWVHEASLRDITDEEREIVENIVKEMGIPKDAVLTRDYRALAAEHRMLAMLKDWCGDCYLEDLDSNKYNHIDEITVPVLESLDWGLYDFIVSLPSAVRNKRSQLGKVKDEQ